MVILGGWVFLTSEVPLYTQRQLGKVFHTVSKSVEILLVTIRLRAKMEQLKRFEGCLPGSQGHNLALTVLHVPCSLASGYLKGFRVQG